MAIRRNVLNSIGGLTPLRDYFVEDYELGRRVAAKGYRVELIPYAAEMEIEVPSCAAWWRRQVAWDQKTRSIKPWGFFFHLLLRGVPIALLYAASGGSSGWGIFSITVVSRMVTGAVNTWMLGDKDGWRRIWLLPVRDILSILVWAATLLRRKTGWRGRTFWLRKGKLILVR